MSASTVRLLRAVTDDGPTDAELLGRFVESRDEYAFALLVRRHGAMVYGVCRRILPTAQDAEDAFQATFLVLLEKARSAPREAVGNWLYGVSRRAALMARRTITTRRETEMGEYPAPEPMDELRAALDEELSRLPDVYRTAIVLCDLEGRTRREAAAILGWPEGTVAGRLVRARQMLAKRLARHAPAVSLAAVLSGTASANVPEVLPPAAVPAGVAALTREVLAAMSRGKLMKAATVVLLLGCVGLGMVAGQNPAPPKGDPVLPGTTEAPKNPPKADDVAWGNEVDGLQIGLGGVAPTYRHGEKAKLEVKLRNVGKADIKFTYVLLREHPPRVAAADGARVSVSMPPSPRYYVPPTEKTIKAGETMTLYNPEIAVEPEDPVRLLVNRRVDTPTVGLSPGKFKIAFGGMIQSHPKLSTGTVEFEVKDRVAWGKEVDGVQVGITFGEHRVYQVGETVALIVRVRNNGKDEVPFRDDAEYFCKNPPLITDANDKAVTIKAISIFGFLRRRSVGPGKEVDLMRLELALRPAADREKDVAWTLYGTGKFHIQYKDVPVVGEVKLESPGLTLTTGKLELEVTADPPAKKENGAGQGLIPDAPAEEARKDIKEGKLKYFVYGQPRAHDGVFAELMKKDHGVALVVVGCNVSDAAKKQADEYNELILAHLEKNGKKDIVRETEAKARKQWEDDRRK